MRWAEHPGRADRARRASHATSWWVRRLPVLAAAMAAACSSSPTGEGAETGRPAALSVLDALGSAGARAGSDDRGFERAMAPRTFSFPADDGPHPTFRSEWWYWTGNLDGTDGRRFGYQLTIFRMALTPGPPPARPSPWASSQVYMGHLAVTDVSGRRFLAAEQVARGALGLAGATAAPFRAWVLGWTAAGPSSRPPAGSPSPSQSPSPTPTPPSAPPAMAVSTSPGRLGLTPLVLRASGTSGGTELGIDLTLAAGKPLVLHGDGGLSRKGQAPGNASYYDSLTRMPTRGALSIAGRTFQVTGDSWMDREWSTSALEAGEVGWDWFALQLADGRELMFYRLRRAPASDPHADGSSAVGDASDPASSGTLVDAAGGARHLSSDDVRITAIGTWTSPHSRTRYPARFQVEVPSEGLALVVTPLIPDQELNLSFRYWEGAVGVSGSAAGRPISGRGYLELTGYDTPRSAR
jgi:predicted secreted hydrolase